MMSGPSHGSPVGDADWKLKDQSRSAARCAMERLVSTS